jgi:hypothetical protein
MTPNAEHQDPWVDRLSGYVDDELSRRQRQAVEAHLSGCAGCRATVQELRGLAADARLLETPSEPGRDLWPGIAGRLTPRNRTGWWTRFRFQPLSLRFAAAAVMLIACVAVAWLLLRAPAPSVVEVVVPSTAPRGAAAPEPGETLDYLNAVAGLEREARASLTFDPHLLEVLDENLATLDVAIANYREALTEEPANERLRSRLVETRRQKLTLLRHAVALSAEGTN